MTQLKTNLRNTRESARQIRVEPTVGSGGTITSTNVQNALEQAAGLFSSAVAVTGANSLNASHHLKLVQLGGNTSYTFTLDASTLPSGFICGLINTDVDDGTGRGRYLNVISGDPPTHFYPTQFTIVTKVGSTIRYTPIERWKQRASSQTGREFFVAPAAVQTAWQAGHVYIAGDVARNGHRVYGVSTGGTSAGSGGPTGNATSPITDNTVTWYYMCEATIPWPNGAAVVAGAIVTNDGGKYYTCTIGGTTAGSGGPTGTGSAIIDSGATWKYVCGAAADTNDGLARDAPLLTLFEAYANVIANSLDLNYGVAPQSIITMMLTNIEGVHLPGAIFLQSGHASLVLRGHASFPCYHIAPPGTPTVALFDGAQLILGDDLTQAAINSQAQTVTTHARLRTRTFAGGVTPFTYGLIIGASQAHRFLTTGGMFFRDSTYRIAAGADYHVLIADGTCYDECVSGSTSFTADCFFVAFVHTAGQVQHNGSTYTLNAHTIVGKTYEVVSGGNLNDFNTVLPGNATGTVTGGGWYNGRLTPNPSVIVNGNKNLADASTTETIGPMGFVPSRITLSGSVSGTAFWAIGELDISNVGGGTASISSTSIIKDNGLIRLYGSGTGSDFQTLQVSASGTNDGIVLNWTKGGTPAVTFNYTLGLHP